MIRPCEQQAFEAPSAHGFPSSEIRLAGGQGGKSSVIGRRAGIHAGCEKRSTTPTATHASPPVGCAEVAAISCPRLGRLPAFYDIGRQLAQVLSRRRRA